MKLSIEVMLTYICEPRWERSSRVTQNTFHLVLRNVSGNRPFWRKCCPRRTPLPDSRGSRPRLISIGVLERRHITRRSRQREVKTDLLSHLYFYCFSLFLPCFLIFYFFFLKKLFFCLLFLSFSFYNYVCHWVFGCFLFLFSICILCCESGFNVQPQAYIYISHICHISLFFYCHTYGIQGYLMYALLLCAHDTELNL